MNTKNQNQKQSNKKVKLFKENVRIPLDYVEKGQMIKKVKTGIDVKFFNHNKESNEVDACFFTSNMNTNIKEILGIQDINDNLSDIPIISDRVRNVKEIERLPYVRQMEICDFKKDYPKFVNMIEKNRIRELDHLLSHFESQRKNKDEINSIFLEK